MLSIDMTGRRVQAAKLVVNGRPITEVIIDPHYEAKHPDIDDALILQLVRALMARSSGRKSESVSGSSSCWTGSSTKARRIDSCGACGMKRRFWA
jgi:hypothetical protein